MLGWKLEGSNSSWREIGNGFHRRPFLPFICWMVSVSRSAFPPRASGDPGLVWWQGCDGLAFDESREPELVLCLGGQNVSEQSGHQVTVNVSDSPPSPRPLQIVLKLASQPPAGTFHATPCLFTLVMK